MMEEDSDSLDVCLPLRSCILSVLEYYVIQNSCFLLLAMICG